MEPANREGTEAIGCGAAAANLLRMPDLTGYNSAAYQQESGDPQFE
jgi:hypothetical protein